MVRPDDPQEPRPRHLSLVPPAAAAATKPLPAAVPVLRPDEPVTAAQDALLTAIAHRARQGDRDARELLWRAFAPRLEPAVSRCGRMTFLPHWAARNGRPWELDDLRQEAWLVFAEVIGAWDGEGSFVPYATAYFPWRLRNAMRRLGPVRRARPLAAVSGTAAACAGLRDAERASLLATFGAALSTADARVLELRLEGLSLTAIARRLGVTRRTVSRRWGRIRRTARELLAETAHRAPRTEESGEGKVENRIGPSPP
jgi:RNA polymerase sigma factor (sigma-70 family)